jgi:hypothetical protein
VIVSSPISYKKLVFLGKRESECLAKRPDIGEVIVVRRIAEMEIDHDLRRNASHGPIANPPSACQMVREIGDTAVIRSAIVEDVAVDIDPTQAIVLHDEVVLPGIAGRNLREPEISEKRAQCRDVVSWEGYIEIEMPPRLAPEQRIHSPASIDIDFDPGTLDPPDQIDRILFGYFIAPHGVYRRGIEPLLSAGVNA